MSSLARHTGILLLTALAGCGASELSLSSACYSAELDLEIHAGAEGDGFLAISGLAVGTDGTAYVLDGGEGSLIAFAPEGDELWRVRGLETGLDDFAEPAGLHRRGELLAFEDMARRRLSFWTETGERVGELALDSLALPGRAVWVAGVGPERVVAAVELEPEGGSAEVQDEEELWWPGEAETIPGARLLLVLARADRAGLDTLASFELPPEQLLRLPGYEIPVASPYAAQPSFAVSPEGLIAHAAGGEYRVEIYSAEGIRQGEIRGADTAPAITAADRREFGRFLPDTLLVGQLTFPATHPAITALATTTDGQLLVRTSWRRRDQVRWDRWTMDGEFVGSFMLPTSLVPVTGVGNLIYGRAVDEIGAQHLSLYRLTGNSRCPGPAALTLPAR